MTRRAAALAASFSFGAFAAFAAFGPARAAAEPATRPAEAGAGTEPAGAQTERAAPGAPGAPSASTAPSPSIAKKDLASRAKSPRHRRPPAPGTPPARLVNLRHLWTKEWLAIEVGAQPDKRIISRFLRDHFTNQPTAMEPRLVDAMVAAAVSFGSDVVEVVSAFRHPKYNLMLRKKGRQVARDSQHSHGTAVDFTIPGVSAQALDRWARAQKLGGVGFYPDSGFVHMDTGPIRTWSGD